MCRIFPTRETTEVSEADNGGGTMKVHKRYVVKTLPSGEAKIVDIFTGGPAILEGRTMVDLVSEEASAIAELFQRNGLGTPRQGPKRASLTFR